MNKLKSDLYKNGYVVVKNLLSEDEITHFSEKIKKICETKNSNRIDDLYNYQEFWDFIINRKLFLNNPTLFQKNTAMYEMKENKSIDVDSINDIHIIEKLNLI